jgi:hypothetical protein
MFLVITPAWTMNNEIESAHNISAVKQSIKNPKFYNRSPNNCYHSNHNTLWNKIITASNLSKVWAHLAEQSLADCCSVGRRFNHSISMQRHVLGHTIIECQLFESLRCKIGLGMTDAKSCQLAEAPRSAKPSILFRLPFTMAKTVSFGNGASY